MDEETKQILENHEKRIAGLEAKFKSKPKLTEKPLSIKEFIISKKPKGNTQKTLTICYFLEKHKGMETFNSTDLKQCFKDAKEKIPKNISDTVYKNIEQGLIAEDKSEAKGRVLYLTNTGEKFVENGFKR